MSLTDIFLTLVDMSVDAAWVALVVMILRLVLKKAPKWMHCCLWLLVAVRLSCPFTVESVFSLVSLDWTKETVDSMLDGYVGPSNTYWDNTEEYKAAVSVGIEPIYAGEGHYYVVTGETPTTEIPIIADYIAPIWVAGMGIMLSFAAVSYFQLRRKVGASLMAENGIYLCDYIDTPFILGIVKPRIYLPSSMASDAAVHVIAHERAHLNRNDHWWKPMGYLLLTIHWFNPVMWLAYILLCRDIELACDEKVIRKMEVGEKKAYSEALLSCSVSRARIAACPLAFGEVGVKERVKSVLSYKKPAFWVVLIAAVAVVVAAVCFLTDPVTDEDDSSELNYVKSAVESYLQDGSPYLTLSESDTALLEALIWDKMKYTATISGGTDDFVFTVNEPNVIDGESVEYYHVIIGVSADGKLTNFTLSGPERMADDVQQGSEIIIPYVLMEDGSLTPVLDTSEGRLYVKSNLVSFYDGQKRPGYYSLEVGELGYLMNILEDIPESAWEEGLHAENYAEFSSKLTLGLADDPADELYEIEANLLYTDGGVNLKFYKDGSLLEKTYHIRYEPLTEFMESLCDNTRREGNIHIMYPDTVMEYPHEDITVALQPMVGWEYEIVPYTDESTPFGIRCRPGWEEEGWLFVSYWPGGFAASGTGLETTEGSWGNNLYDTTTGYYDGSENWSFICFTGTPYVILNEGADAWFERADDIYLMVCGYSGEGMLPPNTELVRYSHGYVNMSLRLPPSWECEIEEWTETNENGVDLQTCGIRFRPEGEEGWIFLQFRSNIFGAFSQENTGTSVEFSDYEVTLGGPQYGNVWRYIHYNFYRDGRTYIPGNYIAWNEGADKWMRETDNYLRLMEILYTVRLGEGVLCEDQALEIACKAVELPEDYNYGMRHDYLTGIYTVFFSSKEGEGLYEVQIDNNGKILSVTSGLWTEYPSLAAAEAAVGFSLSIPKTVEGSYRASSFYVYDNQMLEVVYLDDPNFIVVIRKQLDEGKDLSENYLPYERIDVPSDRTASCISYDGYSYSMYAPNGFWGDSAQGFLLCMGGSP